MIHVQDLIRSLERLFPRRGSADQTDCIDAVARSWGGTIVQREEGVTVLIEDCRPLGRSDSELVMDLAELLNLAGTSSDDLGPVVFLDIETTALNAGTGTLVVVVGLGYRDASQFVIRQYVLHDPAGELAFLAAIAADLGRFANVITFNGKRFDLPMLEGRFLLNRRPAPFPSRHLDLLYPARRIWRRRLRQSNLATLEVQVLGEIRKADLLGAEIPQRYFAFLRDGQTDSLLPVLAHNRQDVLSLARLAGRIAQLLAGQGGPSVGASDLLGLGRLFEANGRTTRAISCYQAVLAGASASERAEAFFRLATLVRQAGDLEQAVQLFTAVASFSTGPSALAALELAKYYEHRVRDPAQALAYARRALLLTDSTAASLRSDLLRRIARLEKRLEGAGRRC